MIVWENPLTGEYIDYQLGAPCSYHSQSDYGNRSLFQLDRGCQ
jgi:hypothetical protein